MAYVARLLGDFDRYLARGDVDLLRDQAPANGPPSFVRR
jgi:hypothetical protein